MFGIEAVAVNVEVDVSFGLPMFTMVGLPDASVRESRDRVRAAIRNCGFEFPSERVTVNLAPADVRKAGAAFDLPIAVGVLAAAGIVESRSVEDVVLLGELSLDGAIQGARACCQSRWPREHRVRQRSCCRHRMRRRPPLWRG